MTIAACYVCPEGVVFGADSTSTFSFSGMPDRHYNHAQKIFEIGEGSTLGIVAWGLGGLPSVSFRSLVAEFSDLLPQSPPQDGFALATQWRDLFWPVYARDYFSEINRYSQLIQSANRSEPEQRELEDIYQLQGGFCIGGRLLTDRQPFAYAWEYGPGTVPPLDPCPLDLCIPMFWGCPNLIERLIYGMEERTFRSIIASGMWSGSDNDLYAILQQHGTLMAPANIPIREAIDWVYSSVLTTIKAMKFSYLAPICGGPIEIATVTTDRSFRWVSHKGLDEAVDHHRPRKGTLYVQ